MNLYECTNRCSKCESWFSTTDSVANSEISVFWEHYFKATILKQIQIKLLHLVLARSSPAFEILKHSNSLVLQIHFELLICRPTPAGIKFQIRFISELRCSLDLPVRITSEFAKRFAVNSVPKFLSAASIHHWWITSWAFYGAFHSWIFGKF